MAKAASLQTRLADAAFRLLAKQGWNEMTLASVARAAKVPLAELHALAPSKPALIRVLLARVGEDLTRRYDPDKESGNEHDRVLDAALTWFEALDARRPGVRALYEGLRRDPLAIVAARGAFVDAAQWVLTLAEADTGRALPLKAAALAALLVNAIPVWLDDDKDLTKTMAQLDADLRHAKWLF